MKSGGRLWTEEEVALLYWALPLMRQLGKLTGRGFPAIAMKLANLLAVETNYAEGLANASTMDKAVVAKYAGARNLLESNVIKMMSGNGQLDRLESLGTIKKEAVDLLRKHGVPLHVDVLAALLVARMPSRIVQRQDVLLALRESEDATEIEAQVFKAKKAME